MQCLKPGFLREIPFRVRWHCWILKFKMLAVRLAVVSLFLSYSVNTTVTLLCCNWKSIQVKRVPNITISLVFSRQISQVRKEPRNETVLPSRHCSLCKLLSAAIPAWHTTTKHLIPKGHAVCPQPQTQAPLASIYYNEIKVLTWFRKTIPGAGLVNAFAAAVSIKGLAGIP